MDALVRHADCRYSFHCIIRRKKYMKGPFGVSFLFIHTMYCCSLVIMVISKWHFTAMSVSIRPARRRIYCAPPDPHRHRTRATPARRISPPLPRLKNDRQRRLRLAGGKVRHPPWDGSLCHREWGTCRKGWVESIFGGLSRPGSPIHKLQENTPRQRSPLNSTWSVHTHFPIKILTLSSRSPFPH